MPEEGYSDQVGDIIFDPSRDDPDFQPCDPDQVIHWYTYEITYQGDTKAIEKECVARFSDKEAYAGFSGYIIVRFIVNCENQTGRFRIQSLTPEFEPCTAPAGLEEEVLALVRSLNGWNHAVYEGKDYDSYMYLNFKFTNGKIEKVLPLI